MNAIREAMQTEGKDIARRIVVAWAGRYRRPYWEYIKDERGDIVDIDGDIVRRVRVDPGPMAILDLWGGGESARAFLAAMPDAVVTSCEIDAIQWPELRLDSQKHGYAHFMGNVTEAEGRYDFIWYDGTGQWTPTLEATLRTLRAKLRPRGAMAVTLLPEREMDPLLRGENRLPLLTSWLERITRFHVLNFFPYRRANGGAMWLFLLGGPMYWGSWLNEEPDPIDGSPWECFLRSLDEYGFAGDGWHISDDAVWDALERYRDAYETRLAA